MQQSQAKAKFEENCQTLEFDSVRIHLKEKGYWIVTVTGTKPYANMKVDLIPIIYVKQPEYWGITVRGCFADDVSIPTTAPFEVKLPLCGCKGTKGIEIIGLSKTEKVDIPSK